MTTANKSRPIIFSGRMVTALLAGRKSQTRRILKPQPDVFATTNNITFPDSYQTQILTCPYGVIGDQLWVKETWSHDAYPEPRTAAAVYYYKADESPGQPEYDRKWISPIFMPRVASRITLEITHIGIERLNECSATDALAEGIETDGVADPILAYKTQWESINGIGSWAGSPWVWVITFKRL